MKKVLLFAGLTMLLAGCGRSTSDWIAQLQAKDSSDRLHAVRALKDSRSDKEEVVAALMTALKDGDAFVRRDAARALGKLGPDAVEASSSLRSLAVKDRNVQVRKAAKEALQQIEEPRL